MTDETRPRPEGAGVASTNRDPGGVDYRIPPTTVRAQITAGRVTVQLGRSRASFSPLAALDLAGRIEAAALLAELGGDR